MAPLGANQDAKTTNGRGELLTETSAMEKHPAPLTPGNKFARLVGIGVLLLCVLGAFLYLGGGWFSPQKLMPARFVDEFERVNGIHSGFRRNHAKGVCVRGFLESNGNGTRFSKAVVLPSRPSAYYRPLFNRRRQFYLPPTLRTRSMASAYCSNCPTAKNGGRR